MKVSFDARAVIGGFKSSHAFSTEDSLAPLLDMLSKIVLEGPFVFTKFKLSLGDSSRIGLLVEWAQKELPVMPRSLSVIDCLEIINGEPHMPVRRSIQNSQHLDFYGDLVDRFEDVDPEPPLPRVLDDIATLCLLMGIAPVKIVYRSVEIDPEPFWPLTMRGEAVWYIYSQLFSHSILRTGDVMAVGKKSWSAGRPGKSTYYRASPPYGLVVESNIQSTDRIILVDLSGTSYETDVLTWGSRPKVACVLV